MDRRQFLTATGALTLQMGGRSLFPYFTPVQSVAKADFTIRIAPVLVELAPGKTVKAVGYNGSIPGPLLRMREGVSTTVDVFNDTDMEELVHWHGLMVPSEVDGAAEEGTPPRSHRMASDNIRLFLSQPAQGWYHTNLRLFRVPSFSIPTSSTNR